MFAVRQDAKILDSLVAFKRFYTPPSKKTWSKQHPDFRTPRPLVEPYNLGRLHPDKEWWKLPRNRLTPDTFMGFPDVVNIPKHGGSLYTHLMDGSTLAMVVYRCIEKRIDDVNIWQKLKLQALKLSPSLDPYLISALYLYFSLGNHYDYKFVSTYIGRILATLSHFTLDECSNVLLAMNNNDFKHEKTLEYIMKHAESLVLGNELNLEQSLRFLSSLKNMEVIPQNCAIAIGEVIEMSDFSATQETLILDALESCCKLHKIVDKLCVVKLFNEVCRLLESSKDVNHYRNLTILNTIVTFKFRKPIAVDIIYKHIKDKVANSTLYEQCKYLHLSSKLEERMPVKLLKTEVIKSYDDLAGNPKLAVYALIGILHSSSILDQKELRLLVEISQNVDSLSIDDLLDFYKTLSRVKLESEFEYIGDLVCKKSWEYLNTLSTSQITDLMDNDNLEGISEGQLDQAFNNAIGNIHTLNMNEVLSLTKFASRSVEYSNILYNHIDVIRNLLKSPSGAISLIKLYERCRIPMDCPHLLDILDCVSNKNTSMTYSQKIELNDLMKRHNIKHQALYKRLER